MANMELAAWKAAMKSTVDAADKYVQPFNAALKSIQPPATPMAPHQIILASMDIS